MEKTGSEPRSYKFYVIGLVLGLFCGALIGIVLWVFSRSSGAFAACLAAGGLLGLWLGRQLRRVSPEVTGDAGRSP